MSAEVEVLGALDLVVVVVFQIVVLDELKAHPRKHELALRGHEIDSAPEWCALKLPVIGRQAEGPALHPPVLKAVREAAVDPGEFIMLLELIDDIATVVQGV